MIELSIVIVSYNTEKLLLECIKSIEENYPREVGNGIFEIIVVDNDSTDNSVEKLKTYKTKIKKLLIIENAQNSGFAKANNIGARGVYGKYILFLNSDTLVYPETLTKMIEFMDTNSKVGAATCRVLMPNGKIDDASHRGFPTPWNAFCHFSNLSKIFPKTKFFGGYNLSWMDFEKIHKIDACAGAFMIVRKEAGDQIDWWDEDYFWYGDDLDFCFKLKQKKWEIYYVPTVSILHYKGASGGIKKISKHLTTADKITKTMAMKSRFQAMEIFYNKHYLKKYPKFVTALVLMGIKLREYIAVKTLK